MAISSNTSACMRQADTFSLWFFVCAKARHAVCRVALCCVWGVSAVKATAVTEHTSFSGGISQLLSQSQAPLPSDTVASVAAAASAMFVFSRGVFGWVQKFGDLLLWWNGLCAAPADYRRISDLHMLLFCIQAAAQGIFDRRSATNAMPNPRERRCVEHLPNAISGDKNTAHVRKCSVQQLMEVATTAQTASRNARAVPAKNIQTPHPKVAPPERPTKHWHPLKDPPRCQKGGCPPARFI